MHKDLAETRAVEILGWLAGQEELFPMFLGATGTTEGDVRARAGQPEFLASVVDFLMLDDRWVMDCAADLGWRPDLMQTIRAGLPGGDLPHWT